jgi:hypothetical protein
MKYLALNAEYVYLINEMPNWARGFQTDFNSFTDAQSSLTRMETRRPYSSTLRTTIKCACISSGAGLRMLQVQLRGLKTQPVLMPFWPAMSFWSARAAASITGGLMVVFKSDWSQYTIYPFGADPVWPLAGDLCCPLLYGFLKSNDPQFLNVDTALWKIEFTESSKSDYALSFSSSAFPAGPQPTGYSTAPTLLPFRQDHSDSKESFQINVARKQEGFVRELAGTIYPQDVARAQTARYVVTGDGIASLLDWYGTLAGQGASFWAISSLAAGYLAWPSLSSATALAWGDTNVTAGDYLATFAPDGTILTAKVASVVGTTVNLVAPFGAAFVAGHPFYQLNLVRLVTQTISLTWLAPRLATLNLSYSEVRPETIIPGSETLGTTLGLLPQRIVLFDFWRDFGNGTISHWYFTSFETDQVYSGHAYIHGPFALGDISNSVNLENDSCDIESSLTKPDGTLYTDSPLVLDVILGAEAPLNVVVYFSDVGGTAKVFSGEVSAVSRDGNTVKATCKLANSIFETGLPMLLRGVVCSHLKGSPGDGSHLISQGCSGPDAVMKKTYWKFTGEAANPITSAFPATLKLNTITKVGAGAIAATIFSNFFSYGFVEWGAGADVQRRLIIGSTVISGGAITLTLHKYFTALPVAGDLVTFYPGCDGQYSTCKAYDSAANPTGKFGNGNNFGADPFTPTGNPTITLQQTLPVQGSK